MRELYANKYLVSDVKAYRAAAAVVAVAEELCDLRLERLSSGSQIAMGL